MICPDDVTKPLPGTGTADLRGYDGTMEVRGMRKPEFNLGFQAE